MKVFHICFYGCFSCSTPIWIQICKSPHFLICDLRATKTEKEASYEPVIWPLTLDGKSPLSGAKIKRGKVFSSLHVLREATQRAIREGSNPPASRGTGNADRDQNPRAFVSSCSSRSAFSRADSFAARDTYSHEVNSRKNVMTCWDPVPVVSVE